MSKYNKNIYIDDDKIIEKEDLYKNFMIVGSIGSGKTSTGIKLFLNYFSRNNINGLILDAKGNLAQKVSKVIKDINVIEFGNNVKYNPLDKPNLSEYELSGYIRNILEITSENNSDTFWFEKVQNTLHAFIIIIRLNHEMVTFDKIHRMINDDNEIKKYLKKIEEKYLKSLFIESDKCKYEFALIFIKNEYMNMDSRIIGIIRSEITRITIPFISDLVIRDTFCSNSNINISGDRTTVISFNFGKFKNISKIISAFIKEDFQRYVLSDFERKNSLFFICDEYQEFALKSDAEYLALSREAKCINILAMQSYTSLKNKLNNENASKTIIQNCTNKLIYRQDDIYTVEEIVRYFGKKNVKKENETHSQNSNNTRYNYITNNFTNYKYGISHSYTKNEIKEDVIDNNLLTQKLKTFEAIIIVNSQQFEQPVIKNMKEVVEYNEKINFVDDYNIASM